MITYILYDYQLLKGSINCAVKFLDIYFHEYHFSKSFHSGLSTGEVVVGCSALGWAQI